MRLLVFIILLVSPTASAEWDQNWINEAVDPEEIIHRIRVVEGLYSQTQIQILYDLKALANISTDYEEVIRTNERIRWILDRNPFNEDNYRRLIEDYTYVISDTSCLERSDRYNYISHNSQCTGFRYFLADSYIGAIKMTEKLANETGLDSDWEEVVRLADFLIWILPDVDGKFLIVERSYGTLQMVKNNNIKHQYRPVKWMVAKRRAEKALEH